MHGNPWSTTGRGIWALINLYLVVLDWTCSKWDAISFQVLQEEDLFYFTRLSCIFNSEKEAGIQGKLIRPCLWFITAISASEIYFRISFFFFLLLMATLKECGVCFDVGSLIPNMVMVFKIWSSPAASCCWGCPDWIQISVVCRMSNLKKLQKLLVCLTINRYPFHVSMLLDFSFNVRFFLEFVSSEESVEKGI